jgi:hypothetical protein
LRTFRCAQSHCVHDGWCCASSTHHMPSPCVCIYQPRTFQAATRTSAGGPSTDPEPKIWAASPVENTPWGPNQAVRSTPGGHGMEGLPPSWSLHRVMASLWSSRVQVTPPRVLHGSEPWALAERRCGPHGRAPPGRPEPQLEPPGGWGRHCGAPALPLNS